MIPWVAFDPNEQHPDWRADVTEHNIYYYITNGPTQLIRGLDSPMLEQAHERQFAISQLGTQSVGFEVQHMARVQSLLRMLDNRFTAHYTEELCPPKSPYAEALFDLRTQAQSFTPLPALDLHQSSRSISTTPSPNKALQRPPRSPLALRDLMDPPPPSATLKRKASQEFSNAILPDDELEDESDVDRDLAIMTMSCNQYYRATRFSGEGATIRARRGVRMRRSRLAARNGTLDGPYDADQLEKDGQLLLALSQRHEAMGN